MAVPAASCISRFPSEADVFRALERNGFRRFVEDQEAQTFLLVPAPWSPAPTLARQAAPFVGDGVTRFVPRIVPSDESQFEFQRHSSKPMVKLDTCWHHVIVRDVQPQSVADELAQLLWEFRHLLDNTNGKDRHNERTHTV